MNFTLLLSIFLGFSIAKTTASREIDIAGTLVNPISNHSSDLYFDEMLKNLKELKEEFNGTTKALRRNRAVFRTNVSNEKKSHLQRIVKFAAASYCVDVLLKSWNCLHCLKLGRQVELIQVYSDLLTGTKAFLALDHPRKSINVVFRGSSNLRNWIGNLNFKKVKYEDVPQAEVHQGFMLCADALKRKIIPELRDQIKHHTSYTIKVIGHSLGGAIASLSALEFRRALTIPDSKLELISFGEPRIGNLPFANYYTSQNFTMLRVVHNHDLVPHVPLTMFDYYHRKRMVYSSSEGLYNCQPDNWSDGTCTLAQKFGNSIMDHLNYFDIYFGIVC